MGLFGRRKGRGEDDLDPDEGADLEDPREHDEGSDEEEAEDSTTGAPRAPATRPQGPWDIDDLPDEDTRDRVDLGALRIPVPEDVELRVDLDPNGAVVAATLVHGEEVMQLGVFAAPRTEPMWVEVREEIADSLRTGGGGGSATEVDGPWGAELQARVPTDQPGVFAAARFIGVDGPRWFLRALITGPLAAQAQEDPVLAEALRAVVVVRGGEAMPPRDPLPLRLPKDAQVSAEQAIAEQSERAAAEEQERRTLPPLAERGPENTETA